jgi:hypothetical protein
MQPPVQLIYMFIKCLKNKKIYSGKRLFISMLTLGLLTQQDSKPCLPDSRPVLTVPGLDWLSGKGLMYSGWGSVCESIGTRDGLGGVALQEVALQAFNPLGMMNGTGWEVAHGRERSTLTKGGSCAKAQKVGKVSVSRPNPQKIGTSLETAVIPDTLGPEPHGFLCPRLC